MIRLIAYNKTTGEDGNQDYEKNKNRGKLRKRKKQFSKESFINDV